MAVIAADKRWQDGKERWARPGATIDPTEFGVDVLPREREARDFVEGHHYSGSFPAARLSVGLPEVAYNGETWFLRRAFAALRVEKPEVKAVVSYSDPLERRNGAGILCKPAHYGTIYQASNADFAGRARARALWLDRNGAVISERTLSKIRNGERGWEPAARRLVEQGADPRRAGEEPKAWLERVLAEPTFRRVPQHQGRAGRHPPLSQAASE
jgi:hypothetical protein